VELEVQVAGSYDEPVIHLKGKMLGDFPLPIKPNSHFKTVTFDLAELQRMNSMGVRQWAQWMGSIRRPNPDLVIHLLNIPTFFVELFNYIHKFVPEPYSVESFQVAYYCDSCEKTVPLLIGKSASGELPTNTSELPECHCQDCGAPQQFDVASDRFFKFLERSKK
jgi:hypothetical protein